MGPLRAPSAVSAFALVGAAWAIELLEEMPDAPGEPRASGVGS